MGLDVYFRRDIANVLRATACASEGGVSLAVELLNSPEPRSETTDQKMLIAAYRQGVLNTLVSVGLAFGLETVGSQKQVREGVSPQVAGLLWAEIPHDR